MSIEARALDDDARWDELVRAAEQPTPFHLSGALNVFAEYADAECHQLVGYKGEEPVGLFPAFTVSKGPFNAVFSPPPRLKVPYLGPTLVTRQPLKRRRRDERHREFVDACLDWVEAESAPRFTQVRTAPGHVDVRPFVWRDFDGTPRYTYVVDLSRGLEELRDALSSDARRNVTGEYDVDFVIEEGDTSDAARVVEQVSARHAEQGEPFPIDASFITDLADALPEDVMRPNVCRVDGDVVGGNVVLELEGSAVCWIGGAKVDVEFPVNDLLDWWYVQDAIERGVQSYDFAGANDARIARYKSKFAPELVPYYRLQAGPAPVTALANLYGSFK